MYLEAVHSLAAERRNQRGVDIQNAARPFFCKALAQNAQKTRKQNNVDLIRGKKVLDGTLKILLHKARRHGLRRNAGVFCTLKRVSARLRRNDQCDLTVRNGAVFLRVEQRL